MGIRVNSLQGENCLGQGCIALRYLHPLSPLAAWKIPNLHAKFSLIYCNKCRPWEALIVNYPVQRVFLMVRTRWKYFFFLLNLCPAKKKPFTQRTKDVRRKNKQSARWIPTLRTLFTLRYSLGVFEKTREKKQPTRRGSTPSDSNQCSLNRERVNKSTSRSSERHFWIFFEAPSCMEDF